ncbi:MAG: hypothetical protein ACRCY8_01050 [Dermatophilaceae bacterium]
MTVVGYPRLFDGENCDEDAWIDGPTLLFIHDSFHPTGTGHSAGHAPALGRWIIGREVSITARVHAGAAESASGRTVLQRRRADADRAIDAEWFEAPDLHAPRREQRPSAPVPTCHRARASWLPTGSGDARPSCAAGRRPWTLQVG